MPNVIFWCIVWNKRLYNKPYQAKIKQKHLLFLQTERFRKNASVTLLQKSSKTALLVKCCLIFCLLYNTESRMFKISLKARGSGTRGWRARRVPMKCLPLKNKQTHITFVVGNETSMKITAFFGLGPRGFRPPLDTNQDDLKYRWLTFLGNTDGW